MGPVAARRAMPSSRRCCGSPTRSSRTASTATAPTEPSATCSSASRHAASVGWGSHRSSSRARMSLDAARRLALELDAGTLPIQGPPGTGKTYAGARMILDLVRRREAGRRDRAVPQDDQQHARGGRRSRDRGAGRRPDHPEGRMPMSAHDRRASPASATTPMSRRPWRPGRSTSWPGPAGCSLGPSSTAPSTSCSWTRRARCRWRTPSRIGTCARSIVLIGDPNQLPMVTQGVHPGGAVASSLEHLRRRGGDDAARARSLPRDVAPDASGRQRASSPRRSTRACSTDAPEDRAPERRRRRPGPVRRPGSGGSRRRTRATVLARARRRTWSPRPSPPSIGMTLAGRRRSASRRSRVDDVIVVAPYNAQVAEIQAALERRIGRRGNVGTVDKFQGQEGAVAIYSMASSSREDAPRDMDFLYSRNRLNVADLAGAVRSRSWSRRRRSLEAGCRTPEQMRMVNALCRFVEVAREQSVPVPTG